MKIFAPILIFALFGITFSNLSYAEVIQCSYFYRDEANGPLKITRDVFRMNTSTGEAQLNWNKSSLSLTCYQIEKEQKWTCDELHTFRNPFPNYTVEIRLDKGCVSDVMAPPQAIAPQPSATLHEIHGRVSDEYSLTCRFSN